MPDEQIPEVPPDIEPEGVAEPPPPRPPRVLAGWIASGVMLLMAITVAVGRYVEQPTGEPSFAQLQDTFATQVSLTYGLPEGGADTGEAGVREVRDDALEYAGEYEEAARIAVVAAYEIGEEPDEGALETLRDSEDPLSHVMAQLYTSEDIDESFVEVFTTLESEEFAVRLAQAHAREMVGQDGGRSVFLDKNMAAKSSLIMVCVGLGGLGGAVCLVLFFHARSAGRLRPVGFAGITVWDGDRLMVRFALYMIGFIVVGSVVSVLLSEYTVLNGTWIGVVIYLVFTGFLLAILNIRLMDKADGLRQVIGGRAQEFWKNVGVGLYGYLCTVPVLIIALIIVFSLGDLVPEPSHPINEEMLSATKFDWIGIALSAAVFAPFIEELAFRGLLFPALSAQLKRPLWAILACGFLFAAIHPQGPMIWPALMATGCAAAYVRYYTGSLVSSITLHVVHNSIIVGSIFLVA